MNGKNLLKSYELLGIAAVGAILILSVLISGCIDSITYLGGKTINEGDNIKLNITENNTTETIFIKNISAQGKNQPFEKDLIGMKVGEKKNIIYKEIVSAKLSQEPTQNTVYSFRGQKIKIFNVTETSFQIGQEGYGLPETLPKIIPREIDKNAFKSAFNNEEPVKGREYINLNSLPWPVKVVDVKIISKNITIEILNAGNLTA